jgi:hypothetical protein
MNYRPKLKTWSNSAICLYSINMIIADAVGLSAFLARRVSPGMAVVLAQEAQY